MEARLVICVVSAETCSPKSRVGPWISELMRSIVLVVPVMLEPLPLLELPAATSASSLAISVGERVAEPLVTRSSHFAVAIISFRSEFVL